ncbi:MAG TPA: tetratricopeptide repeat protein [Candidatus Acidoferrum sp.]|nr:tetratricopeptide repeat protein [Candidatus Acidoferrum sp.]
MAFRWQWLLVGALCWLAGENSFAAGTREDRAYAAAVTAFQDGMWSRAETGFAGFVRRYPDSSRVAEAVLLQAQAQFKQGRLTNAIALLTARRSGAGALADQYVYWTGEAQFEGGDLPAATATFLSLLRDFPQSSLRLRALVAAAVAQSQLRQWPQVNALLEPTNSVFQLALRSDPANELVIRGSLLLAQARMAQKDFDGAWSVLESLNRPILKPELDWQRAFLRFQVKRAAGDFTAALAATTNLVLIAQSAGNDVLQAEGLALRRALLEQQGQTAGALAACQAILELNASAEQAREAILKMAGLAIAQNQFSNAVQSLERYLVQFPAAARDVALLTLGELQVKDYLAQLAATNQMPLATNQLAAAQARFDQLLRTEAHSPLVGKAYLDLGWCLWLAGKTNAPDTLDAFRHAATNLPPSEDRAEALFKIGDVLFAQRNFTNALESYRAVVEDFTAFPAVTQARGDQALYQMLRASLEMKDLAGASNTLARILGLYPANDLADSSLLLVGESLADAQPAAARAQFRKFEELFPNSTLRPEVELAIARTYEQDPSPDWPAAIAQYESWLQDYPTNALQARVEYALASACYHAGNETNAFRLFTNFVSRFPTNDLAPLAQLWVADHYFNLGGTNYVEAERNYKILYQNTNWQAFYQNTNWQGAHLDYQARLMAGRAAMGLSSYKDAIDELTALTSDTNCPPVLNAQALFAYGSVLMQMESSDTNHPLANFQKALEVFNQLGRLYPTNEPGVLAWNGIGDCNLQLTNYDGATNAYAQVFRSPYADVAARSRAQIGFGLALEKKADLVAGNDRTQLLQLALESYLDVMDTSLGKNLRDGEVADPFWVKKAGLQSLPLVEALGVADPAKFFDNLEKLFPQLQDLLEKKRAAMLAPKKVN